MVRFSFLLLGGKRQLFWSCAGSVGSAFLTAQKALVLGHDNARFVESVRMRWEIYQQQQPYRAIVKGQEPSGFGTGISYDWTPWFNHIEALVETGVWLFGNESLSDSGRFAEIPCCRRPI